jgi:hypothetical protein
MRNDRAVSGAEHSWLADIARAKDGVVVEKGSSVDAFINLDLARLIRDGFVTVELRYRLTDKGRKAL